VSSASISFPKSSIALEKVDPAEARTLPVGHVSPSQNSHVVSDNSSTGLLSADNKSVHNSHTTPNTTHIHTETRSLSENSISKPFSSKILPRTAFSYFLRLSMKYETFFFRFLNFVLACSNSPSSL
jgi:hypothetical protein